MIERYFDPEDILKEQKKRSAIKEHRKKEEFTSTEIKNFTVPEEWKTEEYIKFLKARDAKIDEQAKKNLAEKSIDHSNTNYEEELTREIYRLKYFPVLFISSPHVGEDVSGVFPGEPTPLMYATSVLDSHLRADTFPAKTSPDVVAMMNPATFSDKFIEELEATIERDKPRVVGISNTTEGHFFALKIAKIIKQHSPDTLIIFGGAHEDAMNTSVYDRLIKMGLTTPEVVSELEKKSTLHDQETKSIVDIVVAGDAPYALVEIMRIIADNKDDSNKEIIQKIIDNKNAFGKTKGVGSISVAKNDGSIESIPLSDERLDWEEIPLMFRGRLTTENRSFSVFPNKKTAQIMTQMGCIHGCPFCMDGINTYTYKTKPGPHMVEKTIKEVEVLIKDYGYEAVFFDDSTFTQLSKDPKTGKLRKESKTPELLEKIIKLKQQDSKVKFDWGCQTAFEDIPDADPENGDLLEKMKDAGCTYIYFGFEHINFGVKSEKEAQGKKAKVVDSKHAKQVLERCKQLGIEVGISLQFGLESLDDDKKTKETISFVAGLYADGLLGKGTIAININTPYPGTQEWFNLMKKQLEKVKDAQEGRNFDPNYNEELIRHFRFESAHQLSILTADKVNEIYAYARPLLGDGLIGVEYTNKEVQDMLDKYQKGEGGEFKADIYFDEVQYPKYLNGEIEGLHLNHASISNRQNETRDLAILTQDFTNSDWERTIEQARNDAATLVGIEKEGVIFGRNTTEAMKLISWLADLQKNDTVLLTDAENPSIARLFEVNMDHGNPDGEDGWSTYGTFYQARGPNYGKKDLNKQNYADAEERQTNNIMVNDLTGVKTQSIDIINKELKRIYEQIEAKITEKTKCFVISHVIRDTGVELPIKEICEFVRKVKARKFPENPEIFIIVDGAQALGNVSQINFAEIGCDAYVGTPHKTMGSTPLGLGFVKPELIRKNVSRLNNLFFQDRQVVLNNMFDPSLGVKPNVPDSVDDMDIFGFTQAIEKLKEIGYEDGNFEKINQKRRKLKDHFKGIVQEITNELDLPITEVENGTDFIYSFSVSGIDNRKFVRELSSQGIFVSYINRTKLQNDDDPHEGDGVIRVSFGTDNTEEELDKYKDKIKNALATVAEKEFVDFEKKAEEEIIYPEKPTNVISLLERLRQRSQSPIGKIAIAASVLLTVLSVKIFSNREHTIDTDPKFTKEALVELEQYKKSADRYEGLLKQNGYQFRITELEGEAKLMTLKYRFLSSLSNENNLDHLFTRESDIQFFANFDFNDNEIEHIKHAYEQTRNKNLGLLIELLV